MPSKSKLFYYWDSCVFISYLNDHPERVPSIKAIWEEASNHKNFEIITSAMSIAEVVWTKTEKLTNTLDPTVEMEIKRIWYSWGIKVVDMNPVILHQARDLMRRTTSDGIGGLKPPDAIHLATAMWVDKNLGIVKEIHTYESKWKNSFSTLVGDLKICEPYKPLPTLS